MTVRALVYRPTHRKQQLKLNGVLIGCTDTSFAMGVDAATLGGLKVTELTVRNLSNERLPDPSSPGLNIQQLRQVAVKLRVTFIDRTGSDRTQIKKDLDDERRAVVQVWYPVLGGGAIGHALLAQCRRQLNGRWMWLVNDPLKSGPQWIAEATMLDAMNQFANRTGVPNGLRYGVFRQVPRQAKGY